MELEKHSDPFHLVGARLVIGIRLEFEDTERLKIRNDVGQYLPVSFVYRFHLGANLIFDEDAADQTLKTGPDREHIRVLLEDQVDTQAERLDAETL